MLLGGAVGHTPFMRALVLALFSACTCQGPSEDSVPSDTGGDTVDTQDSGESAWADCGESSGYALYNYFPLDGSVRAWEYGSSDGAVSWNLLVEKTAAQVQGDTELVTLEHWNDSSNELLASLVWSADSDAGVLLWSYQSVAEDVDLAFDPPVQLACPRMAPGEQVVTETGGRSWTARFEAVEGCACEWVPDWGDEDCVRLSLDDGDGDPQTFGRVTGTRWMVPRYGSSVMQLDADGTRWSLHQHSWEP